VRKQKKKKMGKKFCEKKILSFWFERKKKENFSMKKNPKKIS